ncbi:bifunctional demethylmenaquinone methyltransferase/2-methoxy-6-polyprenyl-1,4-benzoquinol methylase UbiE [Helicobacter turcicus]|uniref:Demethylmenaquinone methyltransferase n=1 Tax=Helicobacter turcicus TaxID=2867412 RepID=A0ABS7JKT1_9HELI|nr:bifunctional demethylmenaquinone methyltransferase/2-methoxy-6-polyprenyl-1,4-benzoquinol methylase UbiE [Helicobacter turcicus]MBX7490009.1 bifunctional demethylmenaquinone methyltransferase/2-methoxy-6-polyprenyl-1,4-benzoquinol methylase UbiE [Helicobacter turcicus]MBX7544868.1 bifunctional demethylmenaquinone methyltransferase/2-methoxy-6-polyprenyl-1,4-benzoquinol methylase UbiE [Helicobacter turcicus]
MSKQQEIIAMFDDIAGSYDLTNRVMSCGIDISWRKIACKQAFKNLQKAEDLEIADVACGTGDMISHWQKNAQKEGVKIHSIVGLDPSDGMLAVARKKMPEISFIQCEATNLPLEAGSKDILSIAYGIRNVVERKKALSEFARVLKRNGILVILEFTKCENPSPLERLMGFYTKNILPFVGGIVSRNYRAYRYLPDSIEEFLTTDKLNCELSEVGFKPLYTRAFSAGVCTLFIAKKL